jgi:hypothetical protein
MYLGISVISWSDVRLSFYYYEFQYDNCTNLLRGGYEILYDNVCFINCVKLFIL